MRCDYAFLCDFAQESGGKLYALGIGWSLIQAGLCQSPIPSSALWQA